jgi:transposase
MFIREVKKQRSKDSKLFYQYNLVQTARIDGKVKQRVILYLGSDPVLKDKEQRTIVLQILKAKIFGQEKLFDNQASKHLIDLALSYYQKYCIKYGEPDSKSVSIPPPPDKAEFHNVDILGLEVKDVKTFGAEHLCKQVLDKLKLRDCLLDCGMKTKAVDKALIAIAARAIFSSSEHKTAQILEMNSELSECFAYQQGIGHKALYAVADTLYSHQEKINAFLYQQTTDMFDLDDKLVIFDISNTYFETRKADSKLPRYGRSKEKRNDCPQVVFTGVINAQGFIRHSRIYEGNKADAATMEDMLSDLKKHTSANHKPTVVMDAGIATEENLALIVEKGYQYIGVARNRLNDYSIDTKDQIIELTNRGKQKVKLNVFQPDGHTDTWMRVESEAKKEKEQSMDKKLQAIFEEDLQNIQQAIGKKGGTKRINKVWERIGRAKEKNSRVSGRYSINIIEKEGIATSLTWKLNAASKSKKDKSQGIYFIRTNYQDPKEEDLWQIYNTIREVEATFRCLKSDLQIRPVHHQNDYRIESHIYLTILAYQLVNTIRFMLKKENIHHDWKNIVRIMNTQTIQTLLLPTDKKDIHLRKPARPIKEVLQIYQATNCKSTQPAKKKYVVYH